MKRILISLFLLYLFGVHLYPNVVYASDDSATVQLDIDTYIRGSSTSNYGDVAFMSLGHSYSTDYKILLNGAIDDTVDNHSGETVDSMVVYGIVGGMEYFDSDDSLWILPYEILVSWEEGVGGPSDVYDTCGVDWSHRNQTTEHTGCAGSDAEWNSAGANGSGTDVSASHIGLDTVVIGASATSTDDTLRLATVSGSSISDGFDYGLILVEDSFITSDNRPELSLEQSGHAGKISPYAVIYFSSSSDFELATSTIDTSAEHFEVQATVSNSVSLDSTCLYVSTIKSNVDTGMDDSLRQVIETDGSTDTLSYEGLDENDWYFFRVVAYDGDATPTTDTSDLDSVRTFSFANSVVHQDSARSSVALKFKFTFALDSMMDTPDSLVIMMDTDNDISGASQDSRITSGLDDGEHIEQVIVSPADMNFVWGILYSAVIDTIAYDSAFSRPVHGVQADDDSTSTEKLSFFNNYSATDEPDSIFIDWDTVSTFVGDIVTDTVTSPSDPQYSTRSGLESGDQYWIRFILIWDDEDWSDTSGAIANTTDGTGGCGCTTIRGYVEEARDSVIVAILASAIVPADTNENGEYVATLDSIGSYDNLYNRVDSIWEVVDSLKDSINTLNTWIARSNQLDSAYNDLDEDSGTVASIPDSIIARVDSILLSLGYDADSTVHNRLGEIEAAVPDSVTSRIDSILLSLGYDADSTVHNRLGEIEAAVPDSVTARIDSILDAVGTGGGAYPCTLYVFDDSDSTTAVQSVYARIYNSSETATEAVSTTNSNGQVILSLDAETYHVYLYRQGVTGTNPDTITVTAAGLTDTLYVDVFSPSAPANADLCTIYGYVYDINDSAVESAIITVKLIANNVVKLADTGLISNAVKTDTTDSDGYWSMDVYPSADLGLAVGDAIITDSTRVYYRIEARYGDNIIGSQTVRVPDQATWQVQLRRNF